MKRDMDLVRQILQHIEDQTKGNEYVHVDFADADNDTILWTHPHHG